MCAEYSLSEGAGHKNPVKQRVARFVKELIVLMLKTIKYCYYHLLSSYFITITTIYAPTRKFVSSYFIRGSQ